MADGAFDADSTLLDGDVMLVMAVSYRGRGTTSRSWSTAA